MVPSFKYGETLRLKLIPPEIQRLVGVGSTADVTFIQFNSEVDGVQFHNFKAVTTARLRLATVERLLDLSDNVPVQWNPNARAGVPFEYLGQMPNGDTVVDTVIV
jgi:hypothetical protein